jgi:broad specificity phosphatase PhoE
MGEPLPRPAILILIRHGHIAGNSLPDARMNGWTDCPLSDLGWRQTEALRRRMAQEPPAAARYASPLRRARDTAEALSGLPLGPLHLLDDLRELHCGEVDGWPISEAFQRYPELWHANRLQADETFRWPDGESYREFRERCLRAMDEIAAAHPGERAVVVTHAGVISQVLSALHGIGPERWDSFRPGNCSLSEVQWGRGGGVLVRFDDRGHLTDEDGKDIRNIRDGEDEEAPSLLSFP